MTGVLLRIVRVTGVFSDNNLCDMCLVIIICVTCFVTIICVTDVFSDNRLCDSCV